MVTGATGNPPDIDPESSPRSLVVIPVLIFVALVAAKLYFVTAPTLGPSVSDEWDYWRMARTLFSGRVYSSTQYPPLFPLSLMPAFFFAEPYRVALALCAVYSSLIVFPVWGLARAVTRPLYAALATVLSCLLPFHASLPRTLMSENIFFPLLLVAVWLVAAPRGDRHVARDAVTGVVLAALFLTRYLSLVLIPALLVLWLLRERHETGRWVPTRRGTAGLVVMAAVGVALFAPWVISQVRLGSPARLAVGFGIASNPDPAQLTLDRLWIYVRMYFAYYLLLAAPFMSMVLLGISRIREYGYTAYARVVAAPVLIGGALLVALSRHSWRAAYNYPEPLRIMGRYTIYLAALLIVVAIAAAAREHAARFSRPRLVIVGVVIPAVLVGLGWWGVMGGAVLPLTPHLLTDRGSIDAYMILLMGPWFATISLGTIAATALCAWRSPRALPWVVAGGAALFALVGLPAFAGHLERHQVAAVHIHETVSISAGADDDTDRIVLITEDAIAASGVRDQVLLVSMRLNARMPRQTGVVPRTESEIESGEHAEFEIRLATDTPDSEPLATYEFRGVEYMLVQR